MRQIGSVMLVLRALPERCWVANGRCHHDGTQIQHWLLAEYKLLKCISAGRHDVYRVTLCSAKILC